MSRQRTLVIVKPDGMEKGLVGEIISRLTLAGMHISKSARKHLCTDWCRQLYQGEEAQFYFPATVEWLASAPVVLLEIEGEEAVSRVKWEIIGRYPNGIRGEYAEGWMKNVAHAAEHEAAAQRELILAAQVFQLEERRLMDQLTGKTIYALTGMSESGKSTVGKYLDRRGVPRLKFAHLFGRLRDKQAPGKDLAAFISGEERRDPYKLWDAFIEELLKEMDDLGAKRVAIESLYGGGLGPYLQQKLGEHFKIVYIDAPEALRLRNQMVREGLSSAQEAESFLRPRDEIKAASGIPDLRQIADEIIENTGTIEDLYAAVEDILKK